MYSYDCGGIQEDYLEYARGVFRAASPVHLIVPLLHPSKPSLFNLRLILFRIRIRIRVRLLLLLLLPGPGPKPRAEALALAAILIWGSWLHCYCKGSSLCLTIYILLPAMSSCKNEPRVLDAHCICGRDCHIISLLMDWLLRRLLLSSADASTLKMICYHQSWQ